MTTDLIQGTPEWFEARKGKVTASAVSAILGHSPWMTRKQLMIDMIKDHQGIEKKDRSNVATQWGNDNEDVAIGVYEAETGRLVNKTGFHVSPRIGYIGCSPDGLVFNDGLERIVEIKCPYSGNIPDEVPPHYYDQCQLMMNVLDVTSVDLFYWTQIETKLFEIEYDSIWWDNTLGEIVKFYEEFVSIMDEPLIEEVEVNDSGALQAAKELIDVRNEIEWLKKKESAIRETLMDYVDEKINTRIGGVVATHSVRKGSISYKAMEKDGIDIDKYRGKETHYTSLRIDK